jgi:GNAT superfamily N-acetyltransferase
VAQRSLGWAGDERDRAFFEWKHEQNPFGRSPAWVATTDGAVVGFRTYLCWSLVRDGERLSLVRAVDTATDPAAQGRGIFRSLTLASVEELTARGIDAIYNTPNDQSRPGYLKMGWAQLGRPTLRVLPRSVSAVWRLARSKAAAEKWSEPVDVGVPALSALSESTVVPAAPAGRWSTPLTLEHLRWRYGFGPLHYRAIEVRGGICIFRVRRRGASRELAVCGWLSTQPDPAALRGVLRSTRADYAVGIGPALRGLGVVRVPRQGPIVTWRPLADPSTPPLAALQLTLSDLELF